MIVEYHRPDNLTEALQLLGRDEPRTVPLGGGTVLNQKSTEAFAVVDLQNLGLGGVLRKGKTLQIGATLTLQALLELKLDDSGQDIGLPTALLDALRLESTINLRQVGTAAGTLIAADGRSPFATVMLALDVSVETQPNEEQLKLGDLLALRNERLQGRLITQLNIPLNVRTSYHYVARSPADLPIVCAAVVAWPSGRTRVALGGYGESPVLAFDGTESDGAHIAAENAYCQAHDEWASAQYRNEIAGLLTRRCLVDIEKDK